MKNYVLFNPVITSNVEYHKLDFYLNSYQKRINIGDYIPKDAYLRANFYLKNNVDELTAFIFNGVNIGYRRSSADDMAFNISHIYNYDSPQEVNITIDEYIRYEDIAQPYPVLLRFNDENGNEVSWGGKLRVGSTITRIGSAADSNLLPNIYNIFGLLLNDNQVTSSKVIVEKTMVFKAKSAYIFDNNEPKCILSPSRLRIPNSSYKLLGYIPDISGHGNNGVIHNSAYAEGSGVNEDGDEHFNKQEAKQTVDEMYHVKDGKKYIGEKYDMQKAHEVCNKFKDKLEEDIEVADVYVAINAQYHDYCKLFEKWFGKGNFDDMIFESAIDFWFDDVDFGEDKLWKYFNELK